MKNKFYKLVILLAVIISVSACSSTKENKSLENTKSAEQMYNEAMDLLSSKKFVSAASEFEQIEMEHPYSVWATKSKIMSAFAYYSKNKYSDAIIALERFIKLHPGNEQAPYAYYLLSICYYEQISDIGRDQSITKQAHDSLIQVIKRFPYSKYADDAKKKLKLTTDHLAGKEMEIGRYYQQQQKYLAAINRFNVVVDEFETTKHIQEALYRLTETYTILGMDKQAIASAKVLGHNYPKSKWYEKAYILAHKKSAPKVKIEKSVTPKTVIKKSTKKIELPKTAEKKEVIIETKEVEKVEVKVETKTTEIIKTVEEEKVVKYADDDVADEVYRATPPIQYIYK